MAVFFLLLLSIPVIILLIQRKRVSAAAALPPGPSGLPVIGNLHQLPTSALHQYLWYQSKNYGPLYSLHLGLVPTLVVSSPEIAREIYKTHDRVLANRPPRIGQQRLSYNGKDLAFTRYGDYWRQLRKLFVIQLLGLKRVQSFRSIREDHVLRLMRSIQKSAASSDIHHGIVNLSERLILFASSLICRVAFGREYEREGVQRSKFNKLINEAQCLMSAFFFSDFIPFLGWLDKIRGLHRRLDKTFEELDMFYQQIIDDHIHMDEKRAQPAAAGQEDMVDILLGIVKNNSYSIQFTTDHIKAILMNIFIAGTDTIASTLVWAMTSLMKEPGVLQKAKEEIRTLLGEKEFVDEEDIKRLPHLKAVVKETFRLFPAAPLLIPKEATQKCTLNGYQIEPGTQIIVNAWAIGRDPKAWEEPEKFNPDRFLGSSVDFRGQDFELIPFGAGRRICPGLHMGVAVVELTLANLIHAFDWELPPGVHEEDIDLDTIPGITPHKKNALRLMPKNRRKTMDA